MSEGGRSTRGGAGRGGDSGSGRATAGAGRLSGGAAGLGGGAAGRATTDGRAGGIGADGAAATGTPTGRGVSAGGAFLAGAAFAGVRFPGAVLGGAFFAGDRLAVAGLTTVRLAGAFVGAALRAAGLTAGFRAGGLALPTVRFAGFFTVCARGIAPIPYESRSEAASDRRTLEAIPKSRPCFFVEERWYEQGGPAGEGKGTLSPLPAPLYIPERTRGEPGVSANSTARVRRRASRFALQGEPWNEPGVSANSTARVRRWASRFALQGEPWNEPLVDPLVGDCIGILRSVPGTLIQGSNSARGRSSAPRMTRLTPCNMATPESPARWSTPLYRRRFRP